MKVGLLSPAGLFRLFRAFRREGPNMAAILAFHAKRNPNRIILHTPEASTSYCELHQQCHQLAHQLQARFDLAPGKKVALMGFNGLPLVQALFATSRLGVDIFLLNAEMSADQLATITDRTSFDLVIHEAALSEMIASLKKTPPTLLLDHETHASVKAWSQLSQGDNLGLPRRKSGTLVVLTGGTSGRFKTASRKPSPFTFLSPFFALLKQLDLDRFQKVYIGPPLYHGFGLAALIVSIILGAKISLIPRFKAEAACTLIDEQEIEVAVLVPLMLKRMLSQPSALTSLKRVLSGGAAIDVPTVEKTATKLGAVLYNLYGTTEAGFCILATPNDLAASSHTIGQPIQGVAARINDQKGQPQAAGQIGELAIKSKWVMGSMSKQWVPTGDLGYRDTQGRFYLKGRIDHMIVSGGENVYPDDVANVLLKHPLIKSAAVIGIKDDDFGQRLKAFVVKSDEAMLEEASLRSWLQEKVARYQMPAQIVWLEALPLTAVGKIDVKALAARKV